ncbi:hypothetical protein ACFQBQ_03605 [Granulicella cerasi]|uniref:Uncharacterized protein n=1 Tax=Granulicella cerasi TaxID=741063 RepID=A0ABW1Z8F5_9BACT|nr:hypothetical protein [Granulicella cerasi]
MFRLLKSYFWWTHDRGSLHYDIMVTLILAFLFIGPHYIDFRDKPQAPPTLTPSEVLVKHAMDGDHRMIFEVRDADLGGAMTEDDRRTAMAKVIDPIAGSVQIEKIAPVNDVHGKIVAWDATVSR